MHFSIYPRHYNQKVVVAVVRCGFLITNCIFGIAYCRWTNSFAAILFFFPFLGFKLEGRPRAHPHISIRQRGLINLGRAKRFGVLRLLDNKLYFCYYLLQRE